MARERCEDVRVVGPTVDEDGGVPGSEAPRDARRQQAPVHAVRGPEVLLNPSDVWNCLQQASTY